MLLSTRALLPATTLLSFVSNAESAELRHGWRVGGDSPGMGWAVDGWLRSKII